MIRRCAGGILLRSRLILLGRRAPDRDYYPGVWDIIGGHCAAGERPEDTLVRELQEELGVVPTRFALRAVLEEPQPERYGHGRCHVFVVTDWIGEPRRLGTEHSELRWLALAEAANLDLAHPGYRDLFQRLQGEIGGE